jgi:hypothetical protein
MRSTHVCNHALADSYGSYFAAAAYSKFRPLNPAKTEAAYEQNRRIEISIVPKDANVSRVIDAYVQAIGASIGGKPGQPAARPQ